MLYDQYVCVSVNCCDKHIIFEISIHGRMACTLRGVSTDVISSLELSIPFQAVVVVGINVNVSFTWFIIPHWFRHPNLVQHVMMPCEKPRLSTVSFHGKPQSLDHQLHPGKGMKIHCIIYDQRLIQLLSVQWW